MLFTTKSGIDQNNKLLEEHVGTSNILEEETVSPKEKVKVLFQFMYYPEFITEDGYIIINENNLKIFGRITKPLYDTCTMSKFVPTSISGVNESVHNQKKKRRHSEVSGGGSVYMT